MKSSFMWVMAKMIVRVNYGQPKRQGFFKYEKRAKADCAGLPILQGALGPLCANHVREYERDAYFDTSATLTPSRSFFMPKFIDYWLSLNTLCETRSRHERRLSLTFHWGNDHSSCHQVISWYSWEGLLSKKVPIPTSAISDFHWNVFVISATCA